MRRGRPSSTARSIAVARTWLDRAGVIDDPYAVRFIGTGRAGLLRASGTGPLSWPLQPLFGYVAARTRFYDELVRQALDDGVSQVVILAAGYDCRAWRLARPGVTFFEVDHPDTQRAKQALAPESAEGPVFVPADLATVKLGDALASAGFDPDHPAVFCCEGLTLYIPEAAVRDLLRSAAGLAARGSRLGVDFAVRTRPDQRGAGAMAALRRVFTSLDGEPIRFRLDPDDAPHLVADTGWEVDEVLAGPRLYDRFLGPDDMALQRPWHLSYVVSGFSARGR